MITKALIYDKSLCIDKIWNFTHFFFLSCTMIFLNVCLSIMINAEFPFGWSAYCWFLLVDCFYWLMSSDEICSSGWYALIVYAQVELRCSVCRCLRLSGDFQLLFRCFSDVFQLLFRWFTDVSQLLLRWFWLIPRWFRLNLRWFQLIPKWWFFV